PWVAFCTVLRSRETAPGPRRMRALVHALALGSLVVFGPVSPAHAEPPASREMPAGQPALKQARAAWDRGALDTAEPLYREALEKGGLAPDEVLEGYVRLGSIRAARGKRDSAV